MRRMTTGVCSNVPPRRKKKHHAPSSDHFIVVVQRVVLGTSAIGVIYGQAEMLGEPWRHILAVGCVAILVIVAVWMKKT